jgi:hypothetical protein
MNASRFKVHGMTDEPGHCELCGTYCPRRRVAVELIDADGSTTGDVQLWGVVCAAEARHGRRDGTLARMLRAEAEEAGTYAGPIPARRRGGRGPAPRRQTRKEAARLAALEAAEARIVWFRTASPVAAEVAAAEAGGRPCTPGGRYLTHDGGRLIDCTAELRAADRRPWLAAEARYLAAGHPRHAGHGYAHPDGRRAIVNSTSPADVARFERAGFAHVAGAELASWPTIAEATAAA